MEELQDRPTEKGGALVQKLPRAPGAREQRWAHLLCGPIDLTLLATENEAQELAANEGSVIHQRISALEQEVAHLRQHRRKLEQRVGSVSVMTVYKSTVVLDSKRLKIA